MEFPSTIKVTEISRTASEYDQFSSAWQCFSDLYQGGAVLRDAVNQRGVYLLQKPKEHSEVFGFRRSRFAYTNLIGNVGGWYQAALFKVAAQIVKKQKTAKPVSAADGTVPKEPELPRDVADFCTVFEKDCDRAGTDIHGFWSKVFESLFLYRSAYILIDLPAADDGAQPATLDAQAKAGLLDPFLVMYTPSQVINWETDRYGNLSWCIIAVTIEERAAFQAPQTVDRWYYFDREQVACYAATKKDGKHDEAAVATLVTGYPRSHAMTDLKRIPVRQVAVPEGLWLANRVFLPLLNHLNLDNAYDFGLFNAALAQLWIKGEYNDAVTRSEVGYISLPADGDIGYLEPGGAAFEQIDTRVQTLEERIYKACYLMDQARTNKATPAAQSGVSKQMDKTPSRDALSGFGEVVRSGMQAVYADVLAIRGFGEITPDVRGFNFEDKAGIEEMDFLEKSTVIDIQSDTYRRERDKRFVRTVLPDANPETLAKMDGEIEKNPTPEGAAAVLQEQARLDQINKFSASFKQAG